MGIFGTSFYTYLPPYLIVSVLLVGLLVVRYFLKHDVSPDLSLERLLGALFLFPTWNEKHLVQPILGVGWTLSYEMYFYLVFTLALFIRPAKPVAVIITTILGILGASYLLDADTAWVTFLQNPIVVEFLLGCLIARGFQKKIFTKKYAYLAFPAGLILVLSPIFYAPDVDSNSLRLLFWGTPAAMIVIAALSLPHSRILNKNNILLLLGNASYSIYIVHIVIIYSGLVRFADIAYRHGIFLGTDAMILLSVPVCLAIGIAFHLLVENHIQSKKSIQHI